MRFELLADWGNEDAARRIGIRRPQCLEQCTVAVQAEACRPRRTLALMDFQRIDLPVEPIEGLQGLRAILDGG